MKKLLQKVTVCVGNQNADFNIHTLPLGLNHQIAAFSRLLLVAGTQLTAYQVLLALSNQLRGNPLSCQLYLRLTPQRMMTK